MIDLATFEPKRILLLQQKKLGDMVISLSLLEALAKRYPQAQLDLFAQIESEPLLRNNPYLHHVHFLDKSAHKSVWSDLRFAWQVGRPKYDLIINYMNIGRHKQILLFSGAKVRIASNARRHSPFLYTHLLPRPDTGYVGEANCRMLAPLGIDWQAERPDVFLTAQELADADAWLEQRRAKGRVLVSLGPTQADPNRRWQGGHYAELIDILSAARPELLFFFVWNSSERAQIEKVLAGVRNRDALIFPDSPLPLREVLAIMARAQLHIGNCSGPRHFAVAVNTPTLTILEPANIKWTFPAPEHRYLLPPNHACKDSADGAPGAPGAPKDESGAYANQLDGISPRVVAAAALEMLDSQAKASLMRQTPQISAEVG